MIDLNIPNPYQQGVVLDSSPFTNYWAQNKAHELARDEALGQHIDALSKDALNNKNVRPSEEPDFLAQVNKWKDYVINHRADYRRGGDAKREADAIYANALTLANQSAKAREDDNRIFELKKDHNAWDKITPDDMEMFAKSQLPIGKGYVPVNWDKFQLGAAPFDMKSDEQLYNFATKDIKPATSIVGTRVSPTDKSQVLDTHETRYDKQGLNGIGDIYARAYNNDESFRGKIASLSKSLMPTPNRFDPTKIDTPPEFEAYNNTFKSVTGRDISNEADLAKAYGITQAANKISREEKARENFAYKRSADMEDYIKKSGISADKEISVAKTKKRLGLNSTGDDKVKINDAYGRINKAIANGESKKLSEMDLDANDVALVMQMVKNSLPSITATPDYIKINKDDKGKSHMALDDGHKVISLGSLSFLGVNTKANPKDKKTRNEIYNGNEQSQKESTKTKGSAGIKWHSN